MSSPDSESALFMHTQHAVELETEVNVISLAPEGLGFGNGTISTRNQLQNPEKSGLTPEALETGKDIILNDSRVFVEVDEDDDGCGDGRPASVIYQMVSLIPESPESELHRQVFNKSRNRAKVFGGGLIAAASMLRSAAWGKLAADDSVMTDRKKTAGILKRKGIKFGAHTDNHAHGENCGCGAIDKYPQILKDTLQYEEKIRGVVALYVGDDWNDEWQTDTDAVFESYRDQLARATSFFKDAEGRKTMDFIEESGAVVKELTDDHLEDFVVLNDVDGTTFDQRVFDDIMHERGMTGAAQAFAVDVWRGRMYADVVATHAQEELGLDYETTRRRCLIDFIARTTCGPSATLTDGTQPVFYRQ